MMKEAIRALETGALAEIGLLAFLLAFVLVLLYALLMKKSDRNAAKQLPLNDFPELTTEASGYDHAN